MNTFRTLDGAMANVVFTISLFVLIAAEMICNALELRGLAVGVGAVALLVGLANLVVQVRNVRRLDRAWRETRFGGRR